MPQLQVRGVVETGNATFDSGISDLMVLQTESGPMLVSVSGNAGGLVSYDLAQGDLPDVVTWRGTVADTVTATGPAMLNGANGLTVVGLDHGGVSYVDVSSSGILSWPETASAGYENWSVGAQVGDDVLALADASGDGFALYQQLSGGRLSQLRAISDNGTMYADTVVDMASTSIGSHDFLIVASASEQGVTVFDVNGVDVRTRGRIGPSDGLGIMTPTDVETVTVDGATYVLVASAPSGSAQVGAISVLELSIGGQLTPTDHVMDTLDSRFGQVQSLSCVEYNGVVLVAAGGGDDGVTLMALSPNGQLVHLDSLADTNDIGLTGVTQIEMVVIGDELQIFAVSGADQGVTVLRADLAGLGKAVVATDGGDSLSGTSGDDIITDGNGLDTLQGGAGADIFVLTADGQTDRIIDFNPAEDTLDLSSWPLLYDVSTVTITPTATGALVSARGEQLLLISSDRRPMDVDDVRAAIDITVNRSFLPPEIERLGSTGSEYLEGSWGNDTLSGGGGNDTLSAGLGDDTLSGGSGTDKAILGINSAELHSVFVDGDSVTLVSGEGTDLIDGIEEFEFADGTLSLSQLSALVTPTTVTGGAGNDLLTIDNGPAHLIGQGGQDTLIGGSGDDSLWGGSGNDDLSGGAGNDTLTGGDGNDTLRGGDGTDWVVLSSAPADTVVLAVSGNRATLQSADGIDVIDSVEYLRMGSSVVAFDTLSDMLAPTTITGTGGNDGLSETGNDAMIWGLGGADTLTSGSGNDTLDGGSGNDILNGAAGQDGLDGGEGNDLLLGGDGNDTLTGGTGNDTLRGGDGTDRAVINAHSSGAVTLAVSGDRATIESADGIDVIEGVEYIQFADRLLAFDAVDTLVAPSITTLTGTGGNDRLSFETGAAELMGYDGDDELVSGNADDRLSGGNGDDTLNAGRGNDLLEAGSGDDLILGQGGDDTIYGEAGDDTIKGGRESDWIDAGDGDDSVVGQRHGDTLAGGDGQDTLKGGGGWDELFGQNGNDFVKGGTGFDFIKGQMGNDTLIGNRHDDTLDGGWGNDSINAGGDNDSLIGGGGNDTLKGGAGEDTFVFQVGHDSDLIEDFTVSQDILQIDSALAGGQSAAQIAADAQITADGVLLDFGGGDTVLLEGLTTTSGLSAAIDIV